MKFSIRHQLTVIICSLIFLAMVSTLMISYKLITQDYEKKMQSSLLANAESLSSNIAQFMHNAYNINQLLAEYPGLQSLEKEKQNKLLVETTRRYPFFQLLAIHDLNGNQIAKSSGSYVNRAERWWFKKFISERNPFISQTYYSLFSQTPITSIIFGIYSNGNLNGILMADIEVKQLQQMVESYSSGENYAYLLDGEGVVIAHPDRKQAAELYNYKTMTKRVLVTDSNSVIITDDKKNEITEEIPFELTPSLQAIVAKVTAGDIGAGEYIDNDGEEYMCAYRAISLPGRSKPWSLIVVQKRSTAMAFMDYATLNTSLVGLLVILFSALLTIRFSRRITNPLIDIVSATNRVKDGDLSVRLNLKSSNEVGILAENFNQMVYELRQHRRGLQSLVASRTAELEAANQEMLALNEELIAMNETLEDTNHRLNDENWARRKTEENLILRERQYRAITGLLTQQAGEVDDIFAVILNNAVKLLNASAGYIGLFGDGKSFHIHYGIGVSETHIMLPESAEQGIQGEVYSTGEILYIPDYPVSAHRALDKILDSSTCAVIAVPLKRAGKVSGILTVSWNEDMVDIDKNDLESLSQFGDLASVALERDTTQKKIIQMAFHDTLTGLPNRANLNLYLKEEMERVKLGKSAGVILFIDIDDFKEINDNFGHSFGDDFIVTASQALVSAVDETAIVARIGGDEFVVIVPGENNRSNAAKIADKVVNELCKEYQIGVERMHLSASVGVVMYPDDGSSAEDIVKKADIAMYAAKKSGKTCWRFYEPIFLQETHEKMILTNGLRRGLEREEFYLNYQPQYSAETESIVGFEALLRWNSTDHGFMSPARFIPLAEQNGLIVPIGEWVLQEACRFARQLKDMGKENIQVAVNISARQLMSDDFVTKVSNSIEAAGIKAGQIEIEVTESVFIESMEDAIVKLRQLREIGVMLSLDDFGIGYSSLTYLRSLPVGILKIDKSFIDEISYDQAQLDVVGTIIKLGHTLGLTLVAEGVETKEQLKILSEHKCDRIQGYVFSKPLPEKAAIELLSQSST